jgi:hypothetical protein
MGNVRGLSARLQVMNDRPDCMSMLLRTGRERVGIWASALTCIASLSIAVRAGKNKLSRINNSHATLLGLPASSALADNQS